MLILCDKRLPAEAMIKLAGYGNVIEFITQGITYDAIAGHPDIFFCPTPTGLIVAPNLPTAYVAMLQLHNIPYHKGSLPVGMKYPDTARYNSLVTEKFIFVHSRYSDPDIRNRNKNQECIETKQGYVRCNLLALPNNTFMTSDHGIEKSLQKRKLEVLYIDPAAIKLPGFAHGFFGGACGLLGKTLFVAGSLKYFKEKALIVTFAEKAGITVIELFEGQPLDVGTILFL